MSTEESVKLTDQKLYRWDFIWEFLLSRENVRQLVLPGVKPNRVVFKRDGSVLSSPYKTEGLFILACLDMSQTLTFTFHVESPKWIGLETLLEGLQYAEQVGTEDHGPGEGYVFPKMWIIDLPGVLPGRPELPVDVYPGKQDPSCTRIYFDVCRMQTCIPELSGLVEHTDLEGTRAQVLKLYEKLRVSEGEDKQLLLRCAALADPSLHAKGFSRAPVIAKVLEDLSNDKGISKLDLNSNK